MTALDLPAIRALLAGATPGGWAHAQGVTPYVAKRDWVEVQNQATICVEVRPADAAFIAAAPSIVAQLLGVVERVEAVHCQVLPVDESVESMTICDECERLWPCPTIQALTGEGQ